jgi:hypothetical protein
MFLLYEIISKKPSDKFLENAQMVLYYLYHCYYLPMETIFTKQL